jgi:hypothetical protein
MHSALKRRAPSILPIGLEPLARGALREAGSGTKFCRSVPAFQTLYMRWNGTIGTKGLEPPFRSGERSKRESGKALASKGFCPLAFQRSSAFQNEWNGQSETAKRRSSLPGVERMFQAPSRNCLAVFLPLLVGCHVPRFG